MCMQNAILLLYLGMETRSDIRRKEISVLSWLVVSCILFLNCSICMGLEYVLRGIIPGILLLAIAKVTGEAIGYGDGMVIILCGIVLGFEKVSGLLIVALLLQLPVSLWKVMEKSAACKEEIAFLPYILGAYVLLLYL